MKVRCMLLALAVACAKGGEERAETDAADLTRNPFAGDARSAEEGGKLFVSMNCDGCHSGGATGFAAPSLSDGRWRYGGADSLIYRSIAGGRPQGMPAFGKLLQPELIWKLVSYLQSLPAPKAVPTQAW